MTNDGTLYERWLTNRDADAFAELAARHTPVVYDLAVRAAGDRSLAEDLVQEALLDLAQAGTRKPLEVGITAWMARFAICRAKNARSSERSRTRRQQVVGARRREELMPEDHSAIRDELSTALAAADPDERTLLAMRYLHEWEYDRIAGALDISKGAARVRVHRALDSVRRKLGVEAVAPAAFLGMPLHRMADGFLDRAVGKAIASVPPTAPVGAPGSAGSPGSGALRVPYVLTAAVVGALTTATFVAVEPDAGVRATEVARAFAQSASSTRGAFARLARGFAPDRSSRLALPRPPEWDEGELARLHDPAARGPSVAVSPTGGESGAEGGPGGRLADQVEAGAENASDPSLAEVLRPTLRDPRAATCGIVSSDGERAGISGETAGRFASFASGPQDDPEISDGDDVLDTAHQAEREIGSEVDADAGADSALDASTGRSDGRSTSTGASTDTTPGDAGLVPLASVPDEDRALIDTAAAVVQDILGVDPASIDTSDERAVRRSRRDLKRRYRQLRRKTRKVDGKADADDDATDPPPRARLSVSFEVLERLFDVVLADGQSAGELVWPDGADAALALQEVVHVFESAESGRLGDVLPEGALPEGATQGTGTAPSGELPEGTDPAALPSGFLPSGAAPVGPDGAQQ